MKETASPLNSKQVVEQYEILRREAVEARPADAGGHGMALLLNRGMTAWIAALNALGHRADFDSEFPTHRAPNVKTELPSAVQHSMTLLMAEMIKNCCTEDLRDEYSW
jgi:hypothetical protein